jgi:oxygen-dependent protoporphyrinogen oxidase
MPDFSVIGGGIAGLVVARRLAIAGRTVVLYEASDRLGGTIATHTVGGIDMDAGAESFAMRGGTVAALATELGLSNKIVTPHSGAAWLQPVKGKPVPLPSTSILGIPANPLANDVIGVVGLLTAFRAQLESFVPARAPTTTVTVGSLVQQRMGHGMLNKLVAPVVHGVYSMHPDNLPIDRAAPGLQAALERHGSLAAAVKALRRAAPPGSTVAGIYGGLYRLLNELAADVQRQGVLVRLGERVESVAAVSGTAVIAAPGLLQPTASGRRIVLATLVVEQPRLDMAPRGSGLLVAEGHKHIRARALTHATAKWEWLRKRAQGRHVLRLSYDDEPPSLAETARADAEELLGVPLPLSSVIDFARVEWLRPAPCSAPRGVTVVGEEVAGAGLAGIIAHANRQADRLLGENTSIRAAAS